MSSIDATMVRLKKLDKEVAAVEKNLPLMRRLIRWFFTGRAYIANNLGEAKGYIVSGALFWATPAKVWAASAVETAGSLWTGLLTVMKIGQ